MKHEIKLTALIIIFILSINLDGIGDEGFSQRWGPNFLMVRKGKFTIRLKINKAPETASLDALKSFAGRLAGKI